MNTTPLTDAAFRYNNYNINISGFDTPKAFAQHLEKMLNEANQKIETLAQTLFTVDAERDQWKAIVKVTNERMVSLGCSQDDYGNWCNKERDQLRAELLELQTNGLDVKSQKELVTIRNRLTELEKLHRLQLLAISVASRQNTETLAKERIKSDNPNWSLAYHDVCLAIDREMELRAKVAELEHKPQQKDGEICALSSECSELEADKERLTRALEIARHDLATSDGLFACDNEEGHSLFRLDQSAGIKAINAAMRAAQES